MMNILFFYEAGKIKYGAPFIMRIKTDNPGGITAAKEFKLPISNLDPKSRNIVWGDGSSDIAVGYQASELHHTYPAAGEYIILIYASENSTYFNVNTDAPKLLEIIQFGDAPIGNELTRFHNASNLLNVSTLPNIVGSVRYLFYDCKNLNSDLSQWDVGMANDMSAMFYNCNKFNSDLSSWNVSNVTNMGAMFFAAYQFNSDLSSWNVSNVTNMANMFQNCTKFNKDISAWNFNKNVNLTSFMVGKSSANYNYSYYDALLQRWASLFIGTGRTSAKNAGMGAIKYSAAGKPYRDALIADGWTITDGGQI